MLKSKNQSDLFATLVTISVCLMVVLLLWLSVPVEPAAKLKKPEDMIHAVTVTDMAGRTVSFKQPIKRIVLMRGLAITDVLLALGDDIENKLVGWEISHKTSYRSMYLKLIDHYPRLKQVAELGNLFKDGTNIETLIALKPDLVIMYTSLAKRVPGSIEQLERAHLPVLYLSYDNPFTDPQKSLTLLGKVLGKEKRTQTIVNYVDRELGEVLGSLSEVHEAPPSTYLEVGSEGVNSYGNTYGYFSGRTLNSWGYIIDRLGGNNIAADFVAHMGPIQPEYLIKSNPELVIIAGAEWYGVPDGMPLGYGVTAAQAKSRLKAFASRAGWDSLSAVKSNHLNALHMRFCVSITNFVATQQLAKWFYPKTFENLNPEFVFRDFHKKFMPWELTGTWICSLKEEK